jgi:hypothetical protein
MTFRTFLPCFACVALLSACGADQAIDAAVPFDARFPSDSLALDGPTLDAAATAIDAPAPDARAPVCPAVAGGYTLAGAPGPNCPAGGPNQYGFNLTLDAATCGLSFDGSEDPLNILYLTGSATLGADGSFGPTPLTINGTEVTCSATYSAEAPARFEFDCGDCDFAIRYGE